MYLLKRLIIVLFFFAGACANYNSKYPLKVENAYTKSWTTAKGVSRGTHVEVNLTGKTQNIKVLAIVYNKLQMTPIVKKQDNALIVWADFEEGTQQLFENAAVVQKKDMVIYSYKGKVYELHIENFQRKATKYYPVK